MGNISPSSSSGDNLAVRSSVYVCGDLETAGLLNKHAERTILTTVEGN